MTEFCIAETCTRGQFVSAGKVIGRKRLTSERGSRRLDVEFSVEERCALPELRRDAVEAAGSRRLVIRASAGKDRIRAVQPCLLDFSGVACRDRGAVLECVCAVASDRT